jgi:hypothetical protein
MDAGVAPELSIAGGGPAGLACGIRLLERGWGVTVHERGHYPLKKVCGGFLSQQSWQRLRGLGVEAHLQRAPRPLRRARFYADAVSYAGFELSPPAWGLDRGSLDAALAARFRALGGQLLEGSEWAASGSDEAVVDARGRGVAPQDGPWMAWKGRLEGADAPVALAAADLLMLPLKGAYAGLAWMDDGSVCVSLIARRGAQLRGLLDGHPILASAAPRLQAQAAIAGFSLAAHPGSLNLGDRRRVWPPLVGDGIQRALASGEALARSLADGQPKRRSWDPSAFQFAVALGLHHGMLLAGPRRAGLACLAAWPALANRLYRWTRF